MESYREVEPRLREIDQECQARLGRLEAVAREAERLRHALEEAEQELAEVWGSSLPRQNKLLLAQVIRVRCRQLEATLRQLQQEAAAVAAPARLPYRKRWE